MYNPNDDPNVTSGLCDDAKKEMTHPGPSDGAHYCGRAHPQAVCRSLSSMRDCRQLTRVRDAPFLRDYNNSLAGAEQWRH